MISNYYSQLLPEERLLLSLCRTSFTDEQTSEIRELVLKVKEWDRFVTLANGHGIIALCWFNITSQGYEKYVPANYLNLLQSGYYKTLARNIFLRDLFEEVAALADIEKIKIVGLKGIVLEQIVYENSGLRQMSDIDILVRADKAVPLRKVLLKNGFSSVPIISPLHNRILPYLKAHLPPLEKRGGIVEIHARLFEDRENLLTEESFTKSNKAENSTANFYWLQPQNFFLYLVQHIINHENTKDLKLKSYLDLAVLLSVYKDKILDELLIGTAIKANLESALYEKLALMKIFWDFSFTEFIEEKINETDHDLISEKFIWLIKNPVQDDPEIRIKELAKPFRNIPGLLNKLLFAAGYLFPSPRYMRYYYKTSSLSGAFLYYPVRWWRILRVATGQKGLKV